MTKIIIFKKTMEVKIMTSNKKKDMVVVMNLMIFFGIIYTFQMGNKIVNGRSKTFIKIRLWKL